MFSNPTDGLLIAGGGTGGHLFPGIAVAQAVRVLMPDLPIAFVGTARGIEVRAVPRYGFALHLLEVLPLRGRTTQERFMGLAALPKAWLTARQLVRALRPKVVVSVGGYAAGPAMVAAWAQRIGCIALEQNAHAGMTTRAVARLCQHVLLAMPNSQLSRLKTARVIGNPVRQDLLPIRAQTYRPMADGKLKILVLGGSQGAHALNEVMLMLAQQQHILGKKALPIKVLHQTGQADYARVVSTYNQMADAQFVATAFIDDMAQAYANADLLICRSGASTLAEITVAGRPSILVPYPKAADDHQTANARVLASAGAAVVLPQPQLDVQALATQIRQWLTRPELLVAMARCAHALGRPDAAHDIAKVVTSVICRPDAFFR